MAFSDHILNTKLQAPRFGVKLLERPRVLEMLKKYPSRKLTLVCAPAGYGKTVLISQFTEKISSPTVWYQLDQFDNDLNLFIQHLLTGLDRHLPGVLTDMLYVVENNHNNSNGETYRIATALVNSLADRLDKELLLAIDDYHAIEEEKVHKLMEHMLYYLPDNMHVILTSRMKPSLNLKRLRLSGLMEEIDLEKLRFTREEIANFLSTELKESVSDETVTFLEEKTGGWPAALRLAWLAMSSDPESYKQERIVDLPSQKEIYDYLAAEVLYQLPDELHDFVLSTCVLDMMTPKICDLFMERTGSKQLLEDLKSRNLFVTAMEGQDLIYRYHSLFKEFLQSQLNEDKKIKLFEKGGYSYLHAGYLSEAVECFIQAGSFAQALSIIEKTGSKMLVYNRWQTVQRWLENIPAYLRKARPRVLLLEGAIYLNHGDLNHGEALINEAASTLSDSTDHEGECQARLYQARALRSRGKYKSSLEMLEQVLPELSKLPIANWYDATLDQSLILIMQGEFTKAKNLLELALARAEDEGQIRIAAWLSERLGLLYYFKGDYSRSVEVQQRAVEMAPMQDRLSFSLRDSMAAIFYDWGDLDQALDYAQNSVKVKERLALTEALSYAYSQLALILESTGQTEAAEEKFLYSIDLARKIEGEKFFLPLVLVYYTRFLRNQGRIVEARSLGKKALDISSEQTEFMHAISKEMVASVIYEAEELQESAVMLRESLETLEKIGAKYFLFYGKSYLAAIYRRQGYQKEADSLAKDCLKLAGPENYLQLFISHRDMMLPVVRTGLICRIELDHVYEIIRCLDTAAEELLLELCHHEDYQVRYRAVKAISQVEGKNFTTTLEKLVNDPHEKVREQALVALAALKKESYPKTREKSREEEPSAFTKKIHASKEPLLKVQCLGTFKVFIDGKEVIWRTSKARDLFAYLFHHREKPVLKDKILEDLWTDSTPERASTLFHTNLYHLRRALKPNPGKQMVKHKGKQYYLDLDMLSSDISFFETLASSSEKEIETETAKVSELERLERAVSLYQGEYMGNLDYPWISAERERLNQMYISLLDELVQHYVKSENFEQAASCLRTILQYNPLLEDTHAYLMQIYAWMGDRMAVMQQYQTLCEVLDQEMGIKPSSKTRQLYYQLCSEEE